VQGKAEESVNAGEAVPSVLRKIFGTPLVVSVTVSS
jgi:hypothetical protein